MKETIIDEKNLRDDERAILALRSIYKRYGYLPYRMSKFEEYELYIRNKDFLVSDRVITFNDTTGKLMALKPDVTLSIIKNGDDITGYKQKVYYSENVYRVSDSTGRFKEIMQTGLECIGDINLYDIYEVIALAAQSLNVISDSFIIEISDLDILSKLIKSCNDDESFFEKAISFISEKNSHDLKRLCEEYKVDAKNCATLQMLVKTYGERSKVLETLESCCADDDLKKMRELSVMLDNSPFSDKIRFDFSVVSNINYYNGFMFKGFIDGISDRILAGGQYDKMMAKLERSSKAIGFALYLDLLEQLPAKRNEYDVDVLLVYDGKTDMSLLIKKVDEIISSKRSVTTQQMIPSNIRFREMIDLREDR